MKNLIFVKSFNSVSCRNFPKSKKKKKLPAIVCYSPSPSLQSPLFFFVPTYSYKFIRAKFRFRESVEDSIIMSCRVHVCKADIKMINPNSSPSESWSTEPGCLKVTLNIYECHESLLKHKPFSPEWYLMDFVKWITMLFSPVCVTCRLYFSQLYSSKSHINANNHPLIFFFLLPPLRARVVASDTSILLTREA